MADEIDQANELADLYLKTALSKHVVYEGESLSECQECGADIPEARQKAVKGCKHCVECADYIERKAKTTRRIEDDE